MHFIATKEADLKLNSQEGKGLKETLQEATGLDLDSGFKFTALENREEVTPYGKEQLDKGEAIYMLDDDLQQISEKEFTEESES